MSFDLGEDLLVGLQGLGVKFEVPEEALALIYAALDIAGDLRAADALARIREDLRETPAGIALDRTLFKTCKSIREDAKSVRISHTHLRRLEAQIREDVPPRLQCDGMSKPKGN